MEAHAVTPREHLRVVCGVVRCSGSHPDFPICQLCDLRQTTSVFLLLANHPKTQQHDRVRVCPLTVSVGHTFGVAGGSGLGL